MRQGHGHNNSCPGGIARRFSVKLHVAARWACYVSHSTWCLCIRSRRDRRVCLALPKACPMFPLVPVPLPGRPLGSWAVTAVLQLVFFVSVVLQTHVSQSGTAGSDTVRFRL